MIRQGKLCVIVAGAALVVAAAPALAAERTYYIAAEDVVWNYAPTRQNLVHGGKIPAPWTRNWLFHCHVGDHLDAGMLTTYWIEP